MKVEIVSGNQSGEIHDLPQTEAENLIASGFAKPFEESTSEPADADAHVAAKATE